MRLIKEYCCCAIPLLNAGIYITLTEQLVVSATAGILALVTPPIVGASVPGFVPIVFAILCFVAAGIQVFGFLGVIRESTIIFRRYTTLHWIILMAIFVFSAVFIGISASKHDAAATKCVKDFFPVDPSATSTALTGSDSEGTLLCNVFTWAGIGIMGGLWLILGIFHAYLYFVISGYGSNQRDDHSKYYSLYSLNSSTGAHPSFLPSSENIGMRDMSSHTDAWDTRDSLDTVGFEKQYPAQQQYPVQSAYPPQRQPSGGTMYPDPARTMSPGPTQYQAYNPYQAPYYNNGMGHPDPTIMRHPAEDSFHRKTPRLSPASQPAYSQSYYG